MEKTHFNDRSVFVISYHEKTVPPVIETPVNATIAQTRKDILTLHQEIAKRLIQKGLESKAAEKKVKKLLADVDEETINTLYHLQEHPDISLSQEQLYNILARQALFEQAIDLEDHMSLAGLIQSVRGRPLSKEEIQALRDITLIDRLAS